eukprot:EG_transcript_37140
MPIEIQKGIRHAMDKKRGWRAIPGFCSATTCSMPAFPPHSSFSPRCFFSNDLFQRLFFPNDGAFVVVLLSRCVRGIDAFQPHWFGRILPHPPVSRGWLVPF